jgi:hypothetical protein
MACLVRLWEKLAGLPHRHSMVDRVSAAADELKESARSVQEQLRPYEDAPDPFIALMADLYNKRQVADIYKGSR